MQDQTGNNSFVQFTPVFIYGLRPERPDVAARRPLLQVSAPVLLGSFTQQSLPSFTLSLSLLTCVRPTV